MEVQRGIRGSPDQVEEPNMKITLELGARRIEQRIHVNRSSRLVIGFEEDDFGELCSCMDGARGQKVEAL